MRKNYNKSSQVIMLKARELRKSQTTAEKILWQYIRNRLFKGLKFRRQYVIGMYITDFYCPEKRLIIELDGSIHDESKQIEKDLDRENNLKYLNFNIIRFKNIEIIRNINNVLKKLNDYIDAI